MDVLQKKLQQMPYYFCYCYDIYLPFLLLRICLASLIVTIIAGCDVISTVFQLWFRITCNGKIKSGYYNCCFHSNNSSFCRLQCIVLD